jgi:hypothetical protein
MSALGPGARKDVVRIMQIVASLGLLLIVLGFSGGAWFFWEKSGDAIVPAGRYLGEAGLVCILIACLISVTRSRRLPPTKVFLHEPTWTIGLVAIFFSDWLCRRWGLFQGPTIRGELIVGCCAAYWLLRHGWQRFFLYWPLAAAALLLWSFWLASKGDLLFSDDHAMFMFRLKLLKENFPSIPFWSPLWNAGIDARDFFATGSLNAFILASPLIYLFPVESVYNLIIALVLWVVLPSSVFVAARILGASRLAAALSATLSLCSGLFWYRWALKYGTVGFIVSSSLFPLCVALALRYLYDAKPSRFICGSLVVATTLMLFWSPSGLAIAPLAVCSLPRLRAIVTSKRRVLTLVILAALNLPWMVMMWKVSNVGRFLDAEKKQVVAQHEVSSLQANGAPNQTPPSSGSVFRHRSGSLDSKKSLNQWHNNASALNPLIVVFALPALWGLRGTTRIALSMLTVWLLLLGTVGVALKPQLELDRMIVIASLLLTLPLGGFLVEFFSKAQRGVWWRVSASIACGFLLIGPFSAASVVLGRSDDKYKFAGPEVAELAETIKANAGAGRAFFSGCVLHELSGGHVSPLPFWAQTPMIASSYAHNIWKYEQPIPPTYLERGDAGIQEYLDLMNASLVLAHEPAWIEYFRARPNDYLKIKEHGDFWIFKRQGFTPSYTVAGDLSDFMSTTNSISFVPRSDSLTLKFKYLPLITATGCTITPFAAASDLTLISLSGCPVGQRVELRSMSPLQRLRAPAS